MSAFHDHQVRPIGIAIDYDDTFTSAPLVWTTIIEFLRKQGADVFCITLRFPNCPITDFPGVVHYACGQKKWEWAVEHGIDVHIWVDDWPAVIGEHPDRRGLEPPQFKIRRQLEANGHA